MNEIHFSFKLPPLVFRVGEKREEKMRERTDVLPLTSFSQILRFKDRNHYEQNKHLLDDLFEKRVDPEALGVEYDESSGNLGLNAGIDTLWLLAIGNPNAQAYGTWSRIWVGDGTTPEDRTQTSLQGENTASAPMDEGYPMPEPPRGMIFQATFGEDEANFSWNEWGVDNGPDQQPGSGLGGKLLNRKVEYRGTKNGGVWVFRVRVRIG